MGCSLDGHGFAPDGREGAVVPVRFGAVDGHDCVHALHHLSENGVLRRCGLVEEVQERVVHSVDEELRATRVGLTSVRHGECTGLVGELRAIGVTAELIGDVSAAVTGDGLAVGQCVAGVSFGTTSARTTTVGILGVGAAELVHEVGDHAVKVQAVVVPKPGAISESEISTIYVDKGKSRREKVLDKLFIVSSR